MTKHGKNNGNPFALIPLFIFIATFLGVGIWYPLEQVHYVE